MAITIESLSAAITAGDRDEAAYQAGVVAGRVKPYLMIGDHIRIGVRVADKQSTGPLLNLEVTPAYTVRDLKVQLHAVQLLSPPHLQIWIINGKVCDDADTLKDLSIGRTPFEACVYLQSAPMSANEPDSDLFEKWQEGVAAGLFNKGIQQRHTSLASYASSIGSDSSGYVSMSESSSEQTHVEESQEHPYQLELMSFSSLGTVTELRDTIDAHIEMLSEHGSRCDTLTEEVVEVSQPGRRDSAAEQECLTTELLDLPQPRMQEASMWSCPACTFFNELTRPGCEMCGSDRPQEYSVDVSKITSVSEKERRRLEQERYHEELMKQEELRRGEQLNRNYQAMANVEQTSELVSNAELFECSICLDEVGVGEGVRLRECLHEFCRLCLENHVQHSTEAVVPCPFNDGLYACQASIPDREIRLLLPQHYDTYLQRGLAVAEAREPNSFHCKTVNCTGWCIYEDNVNFFKCTVCCRVNCLTCKAIHEGQDCKQYQEDLKIRAANDATARKTEEYLQSLLRRRKAMECPSCKVVLQKKEGCDWIRCSVCKTEICWVRKMPRWGPQGAGDTSGGCKCNVGRKKCHPRCQNCH